jgi:hypothetical protein
VSAAGPQFCPFCGTPIGYEPHDHQPRYEALEQEARARGEDPPPLPTRVRQTLAGEAFTGVCPGCRVISHVVAHRADPIAEHGRG